MKLKRMTHFRAIYSPFHSGYIPNQQNRCIRLHDAITQSEV